MTKMKLYGEEITKKTVVSKFLPRVTSKFYPVVTAIEEAHDMSNCTFYELMSSLQSHEEQLNSLQEQHGGKSFPGKGRKFWW